MFQIDDLRAITRRPGFIHTLSNIIANELIFYSADQIKKRNRFDLISFNEVVLLLSLLSEVPLDLSIPDAMEAELQYRTGKAALEALHQEISLYSNSEQPELHFTEGQHFIEPIFYSAGSGFWFDYLALAPRLYRLDNDFLTGQGYEIEAFSTLLRHLQTVFRNRLRDFLREQRKNFRKLGLVSSPLQCFVFSRSDVPPASMGAYEKFIDRFSVEFATGQAVISPLDYHPCKARPALRISDTQIFAPLLPMLCEQLYESPFYAIGANEAYFAKNANNRGTASELIVHEIVETVQHLKSIRDAKLILRGSEIGQIDVAAVFGSTAIIFEVKTKRLTQASKSGSTQNLIKDIHAGILDAQQQLSRIKSALRSKSYDRIVAQHGDVEQLSRARQVVCVSVMAHEIPAYPLLIRTILDKARVSEIVPINVFDLKIAATYLNNAFDFIYYFATRAVLDANLMYGTEAALLGFHLTNRLTVPERYDQVFIDDSFGQNIDADYPSRDHKLSLRFGVKIVDEIIDDIVQTGDPSLFRLFSALRGMSGRSAKDLSMTLKRIERMLRDDGLAHDATMVFDDVALTFILANDAAAAEQRLHSLREKRDREKLYAQQYMLVLSPQSQTSRRPVHRAGHEHRFVIRAVAMKRNRASEDRILAFSPLVPEDVWPLRGEAE